jgi:hypothetical protein
MLRYTYIVCLVTCQSAVPSLCPRQAECLYLAGLKDVLFSKTSLPTVVPTQPVCIWYQGLFPKEQSSPGVRLTALLHLLLKLRMHFAIPSRTPPLPCTWRYRVALSLYLHVPPFTSHVKIPGGSLASTFTSYCFRTVTVPSYGWYYHCQVAYCVCRLVYFWTFIAYILCIMNRQLGPWQVLTAERVQSDRHCGHAGRLFLEYSPCSQLQFLRRHLTYM